MDLWNCQNYACIYQLSKKLNINIIPLSTYPFVYDSQFHIHLVTIKYHMYILTH